MIGAMMSVDESLMCSFQILKPGEKKQANAGGNRKVCKFLTFYVFIYLCVVRELVDVAGTL